MESPRNEESAESSSADKQPQSQEIRPAGSKLLDLRPEKDPMGAGKKPQPEAAGNQ